MDLIFKRYSSPFVFLDALISGDRFSQGISEIWDFADEDKEWEFYLHRFIDKSFDAFKASLCKKPSEMKADDFETTINNSKSILQGFNPEKSGG